MGFFNVFQNVPVKPLQNCLRIPSRFWHLKAIRTQEKLLSEKLFQNENQSIPCPQNNETSCFDVIKTLESFFFV